ncbi:variant erythrocyte surface antigen-1 family protein [Babesia divergens]|uniref:Variant erythrocyte surface antigen-1 family protein n=1 Tax=Babesia divergens TaxID=32595 RepID=A0AAD9LH15_BABDI|nr:variant erythrocyte surface antigen-1 family protein [Babesia divergens]
MARMVCCMYYTDVFVGQDNDIDNLKSALKAVLPSFNVNSDDLTQLVHGLCLFMGYPSCLCSLKANVDKSLKDISEKLKKDSEAVQSCLSSQLDLNCSNCISKDILCKCCVISCIKELPKQSKCKCVKNTSNSCKCKDPKGKCCKDFLSGLEACLSLLNLKTDLEGCTCDPKNCCKDGTCKLSCTVCDPSKSTITGLGLSRPNPVRLARKLSEMLCGTQKSGQCTCGCNSGTPGTSCCCFCHKGCKTGPCPSGCSKACPGCSAHNSAECGLQNFCKSINTIKVLVGSSAMTCCKSGEQCHCVSDSGSNCSGQTCCVETVDPSKKHYKHSVKCMILRVVKFFCDLKPESLSSPGKCSKLCCELHCVAKTCEFLNTFLSKNESDAQNFKNHLETLKHSSPCGHDLYRTLKDFLYFCNVLGPLANSTVKNAVEKARKSCSGCTSSQFPCNCSSGSPCPGCQHILQDPQLKVILAGGYSSSYSSSASWPDCKSQPQPCCSNPSCPTPCTSGSSCPDNGCCEKCPKRLCAKIFLGMLPCLYYGLKIVFERCDSNNSELWPEWSNGNISTASDLKKFLEACGYDLKTLNDLQASQIYSSLNSLFSSESKGSFDRIYNFVSEKYFSIHVSTSKSPPTTVRQMLLWLSGLPFSKGFNALLSHSKGLCPPSEKSLNSDEFLYCIHVSCFFVPVSVISAIQHPGASKSFLPSTSDWTSFCYPEDPFDLFNMFLENVRKVYIPLNFLRYQCERITEHGGWKDCAYGQSCAQALENSLKSTSSSGSSCCNPSSLPHGILCTSKPGESDVHEHCISSNPKVKCIGLQECSDDGSGSKKDTNAHTSGKCTASCPHPLMAFLCHGSDPENSKIFNSLFKLPKDSFVPPMGFSPDNLPSPGRNGHVLHDVLKPFCTNGFYPLTRLLKFLTRVSRTPPETLGELFAFFMKFVEALNSKPDLSSRFVQWINGEPGFYPATMLKTALEQLYGSSHSTSHSVANLFSLSGCHANKGSGASCGPYLHPLTDKASGVFTKELCGTYLSWICHLTKDFKTLLEEFKEKFSSCCSSSSSSPCTSIVDCPCALATLYSQGFVYYSPSGLGCWNSWEEHKARGGVQEHTKEKENSPHCTRRTCKNFIDQLEKVAGEGSPLQDLLDAIDAFIWSIRLPFFLFILAFWAFVISYFLYVHLYHLDILELNSHDHPAWSFKIPPSILFSDTSSKLSGIRYFHPW